MKHTCTILACLLLCSVAAGQTTAVTLQVTDADAQTWNNGTWSVFLYSPPGIPCCKYNIINTSTPVPNQQQSGSLNATGGASMTLTPNGSIAPGGTLWNYQVCPQAQPAPCFTQAVLISGATQTVTLAPPGIRINGQNPPPTITAYRDVEINSPNIGLTYFNLVSLVNRQWNGSVWTITSGNGTVNPGTAGQIPSYLANGTTLTGSNKLIGTINAEAYGVLHDVQVIYDASWTNGANPATVTSGASDPCFVAGDVGKIMFGTNWASSNQFYQASVVQVPQGTITSFTDCHDVVVSTVPTGTQTATGAFAWGHDDATTLAAAWTAATVGPQCQALLLPSGTMFTSTGQFTSAANCKFISDFQSDTGSDVGGPGGGLRSTVIIPLPSLSSTNSATCNGTGGTCFGGVTGLHMHDFSIFGMGNGATGFPIAKACLLSLTDDYFTHMECSWWGQSDGNLFGFISDGGPDVIRLVSNGAGATNCHFILSVQLWASYCNAGLTAALVVDSGATVESVVSGYGASGTTQPTQVGFNQINGTFRSYGDLFFSNCGNNHLVQVNNGGSIYMFGSTVSQCGTFATAALRLGNGGTDTVFGSINGSIIKNTSTASFALVLNGTGVRAVSRDSTYSAPSGGNQILNANSAVYQDMGGNTFIGGATIGLVGQGQWQGIQGITTVQGSCSGTATSSSTLGLYGAGENTALTCTSTTVNLGPTMTKNGTILGLLCSATHAGVNASSGVVTALKNGAATTSTCTIGTGTACTDQTHTSTYNAGDVLSVQFTTQAAEVLAGVNCTVLAN